MSKPNINPPNLTQQDVDRFWSKVDKSPGQGPKGECWTWKGFCWKSGYGCFAATTSRSERAHRIAYYLATGDWPGEMLVLHSCDFRPCSNPAHLFKGDHETNMKDRNAKGRQAKGKRNTPWIYHRGESHWTRHKPHRVAQGSKNGGAKLNEQQVWEIRVRFKQGGITPRELGAEYGLDPSNIRLIVQGKKWKCVPMP